MFDISKMEHPIVPNLGRNIAFNPRVSPLKMNIHGQRDISLYGLYRERSAFLILNGPSFAGIDKAPLKKPGVLTMTVNNGIKSFRSNLWSCHDDAHRFVRSVWSDPTIMKFVSINRAREQIFDSTKWEWTNKTVADCPNVIFYKRSDGFNPDKFLVSPAVQTGATDPPRGRSVMMASIRILYELGIRKIFLLGCDFKMDEQNKYHFDQDRKPQAIKNNETTYKLLNDRFVQMKNHFKRHGLEIYNCNPQSGLDAFPKVTYEHALRIVSSEFGDIDTETERTEGLYDQDKPDRHHGKVNASKFSEPEKITAGQEQGGITIITPTGDRPKAFAMCEKYMARQKYIKDGKLYQWIVVDDGQTPTQCTMEQEYIRRNRLPNDPAHTLPVNVAAALEKVKYDKVCFVEDDDWYREDYIDRMSTMLDTYDMAGFGYASYYHVMLRGFKMMANGRRPSLAATGFKGKEARKIVWFAVNMRKNDPSIDSFMWREPFKGRKKVAIIDDRKDYPIVQLKGMNERPGLTGFHNVDPYNHIDATGDILRSWIGEDAEYYLAMRPDGVTENGKEKE